jgi:diacylglycerol kinase family enzyme
MAVSPASDLDAETRVLIVAVRNTSGGDLRVVAGNPELYVQTFDEQGKSLQIEQVKKLHVESTSLDGKIGGGRPLTTRSLMNHRSWARARDCAFQ